MPTDINHPDFHHFFCSESNNNIRYFIAAYQYKEFLDLLILMESKLENVPPEVKLALMNVIGDSKAGLILDMDSHAALFLVEVKEAFPHIDKSSLEIKLTDSRASIPTYEFVKRDARLISKLLPVCEINNEYRKPSLAMKIADFSSYLLSIVKNPFQQGEPEDVAKECLTKLRGEYLTDVEASKYIGAYPCDILSWAEEYAVGTKIGGRYIFTKFEVQEFANHNLFALKSRIRYSRDVEQREIENQKQERINLAHERLAELSEEFKDIDLAKVCLEKFITEYLTPAGAASRLGIKERQARNLAETGKCGIRLGSYSLFTSREVKARSKQDIKPGPSPKKKPQ